MMSPMVRIAQRVSNVLGVMHRRTKIHCPGGHQCLVGQGSIVQRAASLTVGGRLEELTFIFPRVLVKKREGHFSFEDLSMFFKLKKKKINK